MKTRKLFPAAILATAVLFTACNKEDFKTEENANPKEFKVNMTDSPGEYEALTVEIDSVEVYSEGSGWITLNNETQFVNVLDLTNGVESQLAIKQNVAVGTYTKLRLKFGDNHKLTLKSSAEIGDIITTTSLLIDLGFAGPDEVEIEINEEISSEQGVDLLVDFNVAQSIIKFGEAYVLKPMITVIKDRSTGIQGEVKGAVGAAIILTNGSDSLSAYTNAQGQFLIRGMEPGAYDLIVYPKTEEGKAMGDEKRIEGVIVKEGKIRSAGTIRF